MKSSVHFEILKIFSRDLSREIRHKTNGELIMQNAQLIITGNADILVRKLSIINYELNRSDINEKTKWNIKRSSRREYK